MSKFRIDFDGVDGAKTNILQQSEVVTSIQDGLKTLIAPVSAGTDSIWTGDGADRFMEIMQSEFMPQIEKLGTQLADLGKQISVGSSLFDAIGDALKSAVGAIGDVLDVDIVGDILEVAVATGVGYVTGGPAGAALAGGAALAEKLD